MVDASTLEWLKRLEKENAELRQTVNSLVEWRNGCEKTASKWGNIFLGAVGMGLIIYELCADSIKSLKDVKDKIIPLLKGLFP